MVSKDGNTIGLTSIFDSEGSLFSSSLITRTFVRQRHKFSESDFSTLVGFQVYNFICPLNLHIRGWYGIPFAVFDCLSDI